MPIYVYQVILQDDIEGPIIEVEQSVNEAPLTVHPLTGHKLKKLITAPNINKKYTPGRDKKILDNKVIEKAGFTKYVRDKLTGSYHKVAGKSGPQSIDPKSLG